VNGGRGLTFGDPLAALWLGTSPAYHQGKARSDPGPQVADACGPGRWLLKNSSREYSHRTETLFRTCHVERRARKPRDRAQSRGPPTHAVFVRWG